MEVFAGFYFRDLKVVHKWILRLCRENFKLLGSCHLNSDGIAIYTIQIFIFFFIGASFNVATYVGNSWATSSNLIHSINTEVSQSC